jgi:transmembrane sensor
MDSNRLLERYRQGICTEEERLLIERWYLTYEEKNIPEISDELFEKHREQIRSTLLSHPATNKKIYNRWYSLAAAAVLLFIASISPYLYNKFIDNKLLIKAYQQNHVTPGGNKAILTLSNGKKVSLTDAKNGLVSTQSGLKIVKKANGQLVYHVDSSVTQNAGLFNTIETPIGGQYQITLSDGTKVWLNAATTLRYPANFDGLKERRVLLNGEAYFEVSHNSKSAFIVSANNEEIKVLGTHFNVMNYKEDGYTKTTLLQGSVKLSLGSATGILKSGEQGYLPFKETKFHIAQVNVTEVVAWKDGLFIFNNTDLYTLMRQISRWYNVDVIYEPNVKNDVFFGEIERKSELNEVLKILEVGDLHFKLNGRQLTVTN